MEYGSRLAADQEKLSLQFGKIANLLREADFWAKAEKSRYVTRKYVEKALEEKEYRSNLMEKKIQEMIERGTIYVDTEGEKVGQVNALSVYAYGEFSFGKPSRITAQTFMGNKGVINIEREAKLSGKTHDKGVLYPLRLLRRKIWWQYSLVAVGNSDLRAELLVRGGRQCLLDRALCYTFELV